jgi:hypothetical protein
LARAELEKSLLLEEADVGAYVIVGMHDTRLGTNGSPTIVPSVNPQGYPFLVGEIKGVAKNDPRRRRNMRPQQQPPQEEEKYFEVAYFQPKFSTNTQMNRLDSRLKSYGTTCSFTGCMNSRVVNTQSKKRTEVVVAQTERVALSSISVVFRAFKNNKRQLPLPVQKAISKTTTILWHHEQPKRSTYNQTCVELYAQMMQEESLSLANSSPSNLKKSPPRGSASTCGSPSLELEPIPVSFTHQGDECALDQQPPLPVSSEPKIYSRTVVHNDLKGKFLWTRADTYGNGSEEWADVHHRVFDKRLDVKPNSMIRSVVLGIDKTAVRAPIR